MEGPVNGIRETFFYDLTEDYLEHQTGSFLYKEFWRENMEGLLTAHFPGLLEQEPPAPKDADGLRRLRRRMAEVMRERPEWQRGGMLLRESGSKQRRDFWEELWLNDTGCRAKLITDTEYYLWLVQYLSAHDIYYKTNIYYYNEYGDKRERSGHIWLYGLLQKGLGMAPGPLKREIAARKRARFKRNLPDKKGLSKADVEEGLAMLVELIQNDPDKITGRLHDLRTSDGKNYLPWLTKKLEWMALHIKIKNWLQDSGYPLKKQDSEAEKKARRSDFTMRLFEAYCDSPEGYDFHKRNACLGSWRLDGMGFCVLDTDQEQLEALLKALEANRGENPCLYIPLAVHLHSGCVFFLAGKANYKEVYQKAGGSQEAVYQRIRARYCFDYLRLADNHSLGIPGGGAFYLSPAFHLRPAVPENAGESYEKALKAFKGYCGLIGGRRGKTVDSPLHAVREYNKEEFAGIPKAFRWAFAI